MPADFYSSLIVNCVFNVFLSCTAILLNIITILALRKTSSLPKTLKTLLLSLAVSDLGVGLLVQPLYVASLVIEIEKNKENKNVGSALYKTENFLIFASFFGVTALSADRFLAIHLHLRYQELVTHKRVVAVVISTWVFSTILPFSRFWIPKNVRIIIVATIVVVCCITTGFVYFKIYAAVRLHTNQIQALQVQDVTQNGEATSNFARLRKSAVGTFYVYLVFLACYLPHICIVVALIYSGRNSLVRHLSVYTRMLLLLNSSLNPLIYCWKMRHIRHAIMNILRSIFPSQN